MVGGWEGFVVMHGAQRSASIEREMTSDSELVHEVLRGDRDAFGSLVSRYQHAAVRAAYHLVRDLDAADDLAQEAFVEAYRGLRKLRDRERFRAWLFGILHNKCLKYRERNRHEISLDEVDESSLPSQQDQACDCDETLIPLLNRLPDASREVLSLRYLADLTYPEIASTLGITEGSVRVRCLRARELLRALLEGGR